MESITIPASVEEIGEGAFCYCDSLKEVIISEGVETIGTFAFRFTHIIKDITIPESVTSIAPDAFNEGTILHVKSGSYAHQWAKDNNLNFVLTDAQDMSWLSD